MKATASRWFKLVVVVLWGTGMMLGQTAVAPGSAAVIYPGDAATINGNPFYTSAALHAGDRVQTGPESIKLVWNQSEFEVAENTQLTLADPVQLTCGSIRVTSGTLALRNGENATAVTLTAGQSADAAAGKCGLPESASSAYAGQQDGFRSHSKRHSDMPAAPGNSPFAIDSRVADRYYWTATGLMFSSSITNAELTHRCLERGACSAVPDGLRRRRNMYAVGLPTVAGVSYATYYFKKKGYRWWFVPAALVTAGNVIYATHATRWPR